MEAFLALAEELHFGATARVRTFVEALRTAAAQGAGSS